MITALFIILIIIGCTCLIFVYRLVSDKPCRRSDLEVITSVLVLFIAAACAFAVATYISPFKMVMV